MKFSKTADFMTKIQYRSLPGYSQSKSKPLKPYFSKNSIACCTNRFIAGGLRTKRLYLSPVKDV